MPTLIASFKLDIDTAKSVLSKTQFFIFKLQGMRIIRVLEGQMRKADNITKKEEYGFTSYAEGSEEDCEEGKKKILNLLVDNIISSDLKAQLNHRDMKFFKRMFYKGVKKIGEDNNFLSVINSYGILAEVKII